MTLSLVLAAVALPMRSPAYTTLAEETVDELNSQKDELAKQQAELEAKRNESAQSLEEQEEQKEILSEQISSKSAEIAVNEQIISTLDTQIQEKTDTIASQEQKIAALDSEIDEQYQLLRQRLRAISKTSTSATTLMVLLDSDTYTEYLIGSKVAQQISEHDQALMNGLEDNIQTVQTAKKETEAAKATLETERTDLEAAKADIEEDKASLQTLYNEADALADDMAKDVKYLDEQIAKIDEQQASLQSTIDEVMAKIRAEEEAKRAEEEAKRAEEEAAQKENEDSEDDDDSSSDNTVGDTSGTISSMSWPAPTCRVITSSYKYRPQFGRYHKGLDICCYGDATGQPIVAAAAGTVVYANRYDSWGGGYGLHVMIDHGYNANGQRILTVYAHCNQVTAYEGLSVSAGDTIGYVGNTGNSFGAHLHFEVQVDGSAVDPIANGYLSTSGIDVLG